MHSVFKIAGAALMIGLSVIPSYAANIYSIPRYHALVISGDIISSDAEKFESELESHPATKQVILASPGGDTLAGFRIGLDIQEAHLATHAVDECASSCANIFLGGSNMSISPGAKLLAHNPILTDNSQPTYGIGAQGWYLSQVGISIDATMDWMKLVDGKDTLFDLVDFLKNHSYQVNVVVMHYSVKHPHR